MTDQSSDVKQTDMRELFVQNREEGFLRPFRRAGEGVEGDAAISKTIKLLLILHFSRIWILQKPLIHLDRLTSHALRRPMNGPIDA